jgi:hypothetical protein
MFKLLTCETWVTRWQWYTYAIQNPSLVPFLLVDRSPCTDPFLDPFALPNERRPLISGLCRCLKNFQREDTFIYVTRIDRRIYGKLGIASANNGPFYLGIAALEVTLLHVTHAVAAQTFTPRRFNVAPSLTPYPPNLAHERNSPATVSPQSCIVSILDANRRVRHLTPQNATEEEWRQQVRAYHIRQRDKGLGVAECRVKTWQGLEALCLDPKRSPIFTPADWGGDQMNVQGIRITSGKADEFCARIATGQ